MKNINMRVKKSGELYW